MGKRKQIKEQAQSESLEAFGEYQYMVQQEQAAPNEAPARAQAAKAKKRTHVFFRFLLILTIVTVSIVVAQQTIFRLETVYVIGNEQKTPEQVVAASGLERGQNMLSIEERDVAMCIAEDHTLVFKGMQKEYPSTIHLYVEERKVVAAMQWLATLYTMDAEGMVMGIETSSILPSGLPVVTGFQSGSVVTVGQVIGAREYKQLEAYQIIMHELAQQAYADQVSSVDLTDYEELSLVTLEGVSVLLGSAEYMEGKIGAVRTCMSYLRQLNVTGGTLNVSDVTDLSGENEAKYMPE